jgi:phage terminase small subunit
MAKKSKVKDMAIIDAYFKNGGNQKQAFIDCGYSEQYAHKCAWAFFAKPKIKALIEKRMNKMEEKIGISYQWSLQRLKAIVDACITEEESGKMAVNFLLARDAIKALKEINLMSDHYSPEKHIHKVEIDGEIRKVIEVKNEIKKKHEREY